MTFLLNARKINCSKKKWRRHYTIFKTCNKFNTINRIIIKKIQINSTENQFTFKKISQEQYRHTLNTTTTKIKEKILLLSNSWTTKQKKNCIVKDMKIIFRICIKITKQENEKIQHGWMNE